ncbi:synaptic vesicle glycoprotein 2C-like [Hyposmocoma kahamanoa]|uniref:synaptic vesicle glycoprotein 2C-like n=1 Tax=Hyposmocoma kahamanoa TaxID=1477025 RepID=UPI000E6D5DF0|nr:synaptic vesicle glycoprotein 2C-like [Hyposmocoma kahamanoa]
MVLLISLVGGSLGAVGWGALAARLGRRRALLSALAVNAVFAVIAAFMPTYGCFMMARFCSAIGSGGIVPTCYTYTGEVTSRACRPRALAALVCAAGLGALLAAALASAVLPPNGALTLIENKEHFSAWHRYLLLCTLPILASLVSLIWTQESPRYLLEVGREVDAMVVYQNLHSGNQIRICGKANVAAANNRAPAYHLGELSLPGKRRPQASNHVKHSIKMFWQSFFQLFSSTYRRTTYTLGGVLLFSMVIQFYLSSYIPSTVLRMENELFGASKKVISNVSFQNDHYNRTLENIEYNYVTFTNCTFRDMLMSHVSFKNCSFFDVTFSNVKTSYTKFEGSLFVNSTIIDTDMEVGQELDEWCTLNGTTLRGMRPACNRHPDLTSRLDGITTEQSYVSHAMLIASVLALLPQKARPQLALCIFLVLLSPAIYFARRESALYIVEAVYRVPLTLLFYTVGTNVVDSYPAGFRSTAHGLLVSVSCAACALVRGAGVASAPLSALLCGLFALFATVLAFHAR